MHSCSEESSQDNICILLFDLYAVGSLFDHSDICEIPDYFLVITEDIPCVFDILQ